jgi:hypothetical protein
MEQPNSTEQNSKLLVNSLWIGTIIVIGILSFIFGRNSNASSSEQTNELAQSSQLLPPPTTEIAKTNPTPTIDLESTCQVTGPSEKKDYLKPYILKSGDTINSIAEKELGDVTRNTEILTLNDNIQQLTVGSILYLPPDNITHSSGHIAQVSGKIIKKDDTSWQLSYGGGEKGPGIWMPGFWFRDIPNLDSYHIGDCVTILFDNSVKVYSVKKI